MVLVALAQYVDTHYTARPQSDLCVDVLVEKCLYQSNMYLIGLRTQLLLRLFDFAVITRKEVLLSLYSRFLQMDKLKRCS